MQGAYDGLHLAYAFDCLYAKFSAAEFRKIFMQRQAELEKRDQRNWPNFSLCNHDVPRTATRFPEKDPALQMRKEKLLGTMLLTIRGTPLIYQGQELGMKDGVVPKDRRVDALAKAIWPLRLFFRDGARTPMEWEQHAKNKGFSTADLTWLPLGNNTAVDE